LLSSNKTHKGFLEGTLHCLMIPKPAGAVRGVVEFFLIWVA
jgi:hypothetical protein